MGSAEAGAANGVWKWVAALLVAIMLAGIPGIVQAYRSATKEEMEIIRERQNQVLIRLAQIDERLENNRALVLELQRLLELHREQDVPGGPSK